MFLTQILLLNTAKTKIVFYSIPYSRIYPENDWHKQLLNVTHRHMENSHSWEESSICPKIVNPVNGGREHVYKQEQWK